MKRVSRAIRTLGKNGLNISMPVLLVMLMFASRPAQSQTCTLWWDISGPSDTYGGLAGAHALAISSDNQHVYVAAKTANAVYPFLRQSPTGDAIVGVTDLFGLSPVVHGSAGC